jgi:signal transduction histidine kinase
MKINPLIDRNFATASILDDTRDVYNYLNDHEYMAVVDEDLQTTGIITLKDLNCQPESRNLIDCDIAKPKVSPSHTIYDVFNLMRETGCDFLPVYEQNQFIGVIAIMTITERFAQALEECKRDYQKVIHDLRNPLGNIHGLISLLNLSLVDEENNDFIKLCNLSCKHAMDILDDLIFVEVDENKPLNKVPTELNAFYKQCINEQMGLSVLKHINVITDFCSAEVIKDIDRVQVKRAVQNVISNAIKFSYPHSTVKITSKLDGDKLILKVLDTGVGIPEKLQDEVFDKFTNAGRAGTNGEPSTGLGLCFTKHCIEQHNGIIYFKSIEGKGTKFYISL